MNFLYFEMPWSAALCSKTLLPITQHTAAQPSVVQCIIKCSVQYHEVLCSAECSKVKCCVVQDTPQSNKVLFPVQSAELSFVPFLPLSIPFSIDWEEEIDR